MPSSKAAAASEKNESATWGTGAMNTLKSLASAQKLTKADIIPLFSKLGYPLPMTTRKNDLLESLEINQEENYAESKRSLTANGRMIIALDMGLKNMSMARLCLNKRQKLPTLYQWFKMDLDPLECAFNPINYSNIALDFLHDQIISDVTVRGSNQHISVLLERQRFRTAGSSAVLESTLKTNTLEAMLCMGVATHNRATKNTDIQINTISSPPGAMVKYWQRYFPPEEKFSEKQSKQFRMDLVLNFLLSVLKPLKLCPKKVKEHSLISSLPNPEKAKPKFSLSEQLVHGLVTILKTSEGEKRWNAAWSFKSQSRRLWEVARIINEANDDDYRVSDDGWGVKKGDDLADSLLHGIAHLEYQQNREVFHNLVQEGGDIRSFLLA